MKRKQTIHPAAALAFSLFFVLSGAVPSPAKSLRENDMVPGSAPSASAVEPSFEFEAVVEGVEVVHEFLIENRGGSVLILKDIETDCGCTTADFSQEIQPYSTGRVLITADTQGYGGSKFHQKITVYTNDPLNEKLVLEIAGEVKRFAEITPSRLMIKGSVTEKHVARVRIVPEPEFDFKIERVETVDLENAVSVDVERQSEGFLVTVRNQQNKPGIYVGKIVLKTDNDRKPEIEIPVLMGLKP